MNASRLRPNNEFDRGAFIAPRGAVGSDRRAFTRSWSQTDLFRGIFSLAGGRARAPGNTKYMKHLL